MLPISRSECRRVARILQSYLDGEVDARTEAMVSDHLEACHKCGLEASTYRSIKRAISGSAGPVDADAAQRLRRFAEQLSGPQP